ncbi:unnamed protein product [Caenorhabditis auriculariae]|uniref:Uncharacterized protein n=1 Tax=Caenorhabditis auriculariae TaxID=2777116 RepID=A0A8S1HNR7_9PELO|nr:unnamed protein product [Caenorhabditis auriculariae]
MLLPNRVLLNAALHWKCVPCISIQVRENAWRASLGKVSRKEYLKRFQVRLIRPDGSTIMVPSSEPRQVFQSAIDIKQLSEDERRQRLAARKPKAKKIVQENIDDNFDAGEYMKFFDAPSTKKTKSSN